MQDPFFHNLYDKDGNLNPDAWNRLPEHLQGAKETFGRYKNIEELMGAHFNLRQQLSKGGLVRPDENAPDSVKEEFRSKMAELNGAPENPRDYGFKVPEDMAENVLWPEGQEKGYEDILHKHGASPELAGELFQYHLDNIQQSPEQVEAIATQHREAQMDVLIKEHGADADKVIQGAQEVARHFGLSKDAITHAGQNAEIVSLLHDFRMGYMSEDQIVKGTPDGSVGSGGQDNLAQAAEHGRLAWEAQQKGDSTNYNLHYEKQQHYNRLAAKQMARRS
jgi:hypothetical protein